MGIAAKRTLTILAIVFVIAAGVGTFSYANWMHDRGEKLFLQAEAEDNRGQYRSAADLYEALVLRYPSSSRVDDALFRLGFLYANLLNDPDRSLNAYRQLLELTPKSPLADEALAKIAELRLEAQDVAGATRTYQEIIQRFSDDPGIVAQTYLRMARVFYRQGDADGADRACQAVLRVQAPPENLAEAQYLLAQITEKLRRDPKTALEMYKRMVKDYPNSYFAPEAESRIRSVEEETAAIQEATRSSAVYLPIRVEPAEAALYSDTGLIEALRVLMAQQDVEISSVKLMGFSGEAFKFFYNAQDRLGGVDVYASGPLKRVALALGFNSARLRYAPTAEAAWKAAKEALDQGYAVMTTFVLPPPNWAVLVGYDEGTSEVRIFSPQKKYQAYSLEDFQARWATPFCPGLRIGGQARPRGYPIFVLGRRSSSQPAASVVRQVLEEAVKTARAEALGGFATGSAAFTALADDLEKLDARQLSQEDIRQLDDWFGYPLNRLLAARRAAQQFLPLWAGSFGGGRAHIEKAAALYGQSAQDITALNAAFEAARSGRAPADPEQTASAIARRLATLEGEIIDELAAAL